MRQHRAFRAASSARGVENRSQITARPTRCFEFGGRGGDRRRECPITLDSETFDGPQVERLRKRANRLEPVGTAKGERRFGVAKKIFELGERVGGVQRQQNRARSKASEHDNDHVS